MADAGGVGEEEEYVDALGVISALERTCELESKLRQAIQDTHPLTTTLDWDFHAADREREALLGISEQLEYLEDKLREYRFLEPSDLENKAVLLGQLDAVRRELVTVVDQCMPHIMFGKEVVREVLAFAQVCDGGDPTGAQLEGVDVEDEDGEESMLSGLQEARDMLLPRGVGGQPLRRLSNSMGGFASEIEADEEGSDQGQGQLIQAVRRSSSGGLASRPPRYPTHHNHQGSKEQLYGMVGGGGGSAKSGGEVSPSKRHSAPQPGNTSPSSLHQQHQAHLALMQQQQSPTRSAFLQQQQQHDQYQQQQRSYQQAGGLGLKDRRQQHTLGANAVPGALASRGKSQNDSRGNGPGVAPGGMISLASRQGRRRIDVEAAAPSSQQLPSRASSDAGSEGYGYASQEAGLPPPQQQHHYPQHQHQHQHQQSTPTAAAAAAAQQLRVSTGQPLPSPNSYPVAPSEGAPSSMHSPYSTTSTAAGGGRGGGGGHKPARRTSSSFLNNARLASGYGDSANSARYDSPYSTGSGRMRAVDEDIYSIDYGSLEGGSSRPASITNPSPRQYGGFLKIGDRLSKAEEEKRAAEAKEAHRQPMPPRIFGDGVQGDEEWELGSEIQPSTYTSHHLELPRRYSSSDRRSASPPRDRLHLAYSSGGAGVVGGQSSRLPAASRGRTLSDVSHRAHGLSSTRAAAMSESSGGGSGGSGKSSGGLLGRLTNLLLTGAAAATVAVVAQHAGPVVVQKGQEVARHLQEQQAQLVSKWQQAQQRSKEAQRQQQKRREAQKAVQAVQAQQAQAARQAQLQAQARQAQQQAQAQARQEQVQAAKEAKEARLAQAQAAQQARQAQVQAAQQAQQAAQQAQQQSRFSGLREGQRMTDLPRPPQWHSQPSTRASPQRNGSAAASGNGAAAALAAAAAIADPLPPHLAKARASPGRAGSVSSTPGRHHALPGTPGRAGALPGTPGRPSSGSRSGSVGGTPQRVPPVVRSYPQPHGDLFPAMPPPDVSQSMG